MSPKKALVSRHTVRRLMLKRPEETSYTIEWASSVRINLPVSEVVHDDVPDAELAKKVDVGSI